MDNLNHNQFCDELCEWLKERGFVNDRGWKNPKEHGMKNTILITDTLSLIPVNRRSNLNGVSTTRSV